jgi:hypothetical protein
MGLDDQNGIYAPAAQASDTAYLEFLPGSERGALPCMLKAP